MTRTSSTTAVRALALAAAAVLAPAQAQPLLQTDATWQVTASAPAAGWNTSSAFDTSSWQTATVLYDVADHLFDQLYTAQGLWSSGGQFSTTEHELWARRVFDLAALPQAASLIGGFDDDGDVWVNGQQVVSNHNGFADNFSVADLLPYLQTGTNLIAFSATDNFRVWGHQHSAWLQIDGTPAASGGNVPEPHALLLMLAGLTALGVTRRRPQVGP